MAAEREQKGAEKVNSNRTELEELAESDNPASWIAEELLDAADGYGENNE